MKTAQTASVGRYDPDRYVPEQLPADDRGRRLWGIRDRRTGELVLNSDETERFTMRDSAETWIRGQRALDSVGR